MIRVLSLSGDRADLGMLAPVWSQTVRYGIDLHVFATGAHCGAVGGSDAILPVPAETTVHRGGANLGGSAGDAARAMARVMGAFGDLCESLHPDIILAGGDRLELLAALSATVPFNIPIAHLHGGEITLGAVDDRIRHAVTKLSHLHFVSNAFAAERICAMGEDSWRIHIVGAPGLDALLQTDDMARDAFAREVGLESTQNLRLVTVHPETNSEDPLAPARAVLAALEKWPGPTLLTAPNGDPGGVVIRRKIEEFAAGRVNVSYRPSLGVTLYANALRLASVMIGNSSSGIVEAGMFGLPVVDVGRRQEGRERGANVVSVVADPDAIVTAGQAVIGKRFSARSSLYGDGQAAPRIAAVLADPPPRSRLLEKYFARTTDSFVAPWQDATLSMEAL